MEILIATLADARGSPRPNRLLRHLAREHQVTLLSYADDVEGAEAIQIQPASRTRPGKLLEGIMCRLGLWRLHQWSNKSWRRAASALNQRSFDIIFCHDLSLMPLLLRIKGKAKIVLDLREYYPEQFSNRPLWRFLFKRYTQALCRNYIHHADKVFTVSEGLAQAYKENFGVDVDLWISLPDRFDLSPSATPGERVRIIHHGGCLRSRKIEQMIELMDHVDDRFHLDLMLTLTDSAYYRKIQAMAEVRQNVDVIKPVAFDAIIPSLSTYDIGLYICPPSNFNQEHALPNKFFEFIQARLCLVIAPSVDMKRMLEKYQVGATSRDFSPQSLAKTLNSLSAEDVDRFKQNSDQAARVLNVESNNEMINATISGLLAEK